MAAWRWDPVARRYVSASGDTVDAADLVALRDLIADQGAAAARDLIVRYFAGEITLSGWAEAFAGLIDDVIRAGYLLGRGGINAAERRDKDRIVELVREQADFAKGFARDLAAERLTEAQAGARAELYAGAAVRAYEEGYAAANGVSLPCYPGDGGTACGGRCRCNWDLAILDDRIEATWVTEDDVRVCNGCYERGRRYALLLLPLDRATSDRARSGPIDDGDEAGSRSWVPYGRARSVEEIETHLRELGISVTGMRDDDDISIVNLLTEAVARLREAEIAVPPDWEILSWAPEVRSIATYDPTTGGIRLNRSHPFWTDPVAKMKILRLENRVSTDDPAGILFHETAHWLHNQVRADLMIHGEGILSVEQTEIAMLVSRYAAIDAAEFVGEVFAALRCGRRLSDEVIALYNEFGGPNP